MNLIHPVSEPEATPGTGKLENIFEKYGKVMLAAAVDILGNENEASDAVANAFVQMVKVADKIEMSDGDRVRAYVLTSVRNAARNMARSRKRNRAVINKVIPRGTSKPDKLSFETNQRLRQIVESMPDIYRDVIRLKYFCGADNTQTAMTLGITVDAVKKRHQRALKILRKNIEEERKRT